MEERHKKLFLWREKGAKDKGENVAEGNAAMLREKWERERKRERERKKENF